MTPCSRRRLLQMAGALAASKPLRLLGQPYLVDRQTSFGLAPGTRMYAVLKAARPHEAGIAAFVWRGAAWQQQQFLPAAGAGAMLADAAGRRVFVAHSAGAPGSPAGHVQVLHIDTQTGHFTSVSRQCLALASRFPLALALSPDESMLAVVAAGGVFSILPMQPDGTPAEVSAAHKHLAAAVDRTSAVALSFAQSSQDGSPVHASQLMLNTAQQSIRFECGFDGMTLAGITEPESVSAAPDPPSLPAGVRSFVLLPTLS